MFETGKSIPALPKNSQTGKPGLLIGCERCLHWFGTKLQISETFVARQGSEGLAFCWISRKLVFFLLTEWMIWVIFHLIPEVAFKDWVMGIIALAAAVNFSVPILAHTYVNIHVTWRYTIERLKRGQNLK